MVLTHLGVALVRRVATYKHDSKVIQLRFVSVLEVGTAVAGI